MNKYEELKERHRKEFEEFPKMFAFSKEQFEEGKRKLKVSSDKHLIGIGAGGYIRNADRQAYLALISRHVAERKEAMRDAEYCYEMFRCELANHEYAYNRDLMDALSACGLTEKEVIENPMLSEALERAKVDCLEGCEVYVW